MCAVLVCLQQGNCVDAVKQWYSQNALYIWSDKPYTSNAPLVKVGDFTQVNLVHLLHCPQQYLDLRALV